MVALGTGRMDHAQRAAVIGDETHMTKRPDNHLNGVIKRISFLPARWQLRAFDFIFGAFTRAYWHLGIRTKLLEPTRVEMTLKNRRRLRNHVGGIHGVICQVPGEYAAGVLVGHWVPKGTVIVVKTITANLRKPVRGHIRAVATLSDVALAPLMSQDKGELSIPVEIIDETGEAPMHLNVVMAWFQKGSRATAQT